MNSLFQYRVIPGYVDYSVNCCGSIWSHLSNTFITPYMLNGYLAVDVFGTSITTTLPIHRAVGLTWVYNPDPARYTIMNHKDGNPLNNYCGNLEWTDYSGNMYHAIENGLRTDNIACKVRDFYTGQISYFPSLAQAAVMMGLRRDTPLSILFPKKFGSLVAGRFEVKYQTDESPWFYESRNELVPQSRYLISVKEPNGNTRELYSTKNLLREFKLYGSKERSIPALVSFANSVYPEYDFSYIDSYAQNTCAPRRRVKSLRQSVLARHRVYGELPFESLTKCAAYFGVERDTIVKRLDNNRELNGWSFVYT